MRRRALWNGVRVRAGQAIILRLAFRTTVSPGVGNKGRSTVQRLTPGERIEEVGVRLGF